ncbi:MAG TPA: hypothetical protein VGS80_11305 [Ktedonobacterales bacterium]|nr:hypothetical protein [Ktedonobacterales bacterium]
MLRAANDAIIEQVRLMQQVSVLEQELQAARFEVERVDDLGNADLARIGADLRATLDTITAELRHRHWTDEVPEGEGNHGRGAGHPSAA